ncbi:MAG: HU family DNA-binding protein [archaeon]|nr:HU family DNA-binding protein [archaeon]
MGSSTKNEIIDELTNLSGLKRKNVAFIIDNFLDLILNSISNNEKVELRGFGSFYKTHKKERKIYSPIAGREVDVPAEAVLTFKASKVTKKKIK